MNSYLPAIDQAIHWINSQMLTFDHGYYGIYERIRIDEHIRTNWSRPDCNAEYLRVLEMRGRLTGEDRDPVLEGNILSFLERSQDKEPLSVWKGSLPFYLTDGYIRENKADASLYQNDNGKIMIAMCQLHQSTGDGRMLAIAEGLAEYWLKTQQTDGTYGVIDGKNMQECRKGPCFVQWLVSGFYRLYDITGKDRYLESAEKGMAYLLPMILPDGRCRTSYEIIRMEDWRPVSSETAIMLSVLATAYRTTGNPVYLEKLTETAAYLLSLQHAGGAILNCRGDCLEASLQNNGDLCDLVYTQGFALQALVDAYQTAGDRKWLDAAFRLGDFLIRIQCSGESELWDGGWRGSYNVITGGWDGRANQNNLIDEGGMYSVYTGWCCTNIVYGLELLEQLR
ncbi:MAG: beta-L-arabinofuranosidase domain-containing protein [Saccharofermentanales bacterium]